MKEFTAAALVCIGLCLCFAVSAAAVLANDSVCDEVESNKISGERLHSREESSCRNKMSITESLQDWSRDPLFENMSNEVPCAFPVIDYADTASWTLERWDEQVKLPFVLRGFVNLWPGAKLWKRTTFLEKYGDNDVKVGVQSGIIYQNGRAEVSHKFKDYLSDIRKSVKASKKAGKEVEAVTKASMRKKQINISQDNILFEPFAFDNSIMQSLPELASEYTTPPIFGKATNMRPKSLRDLKWMPMLSLGPTRAGLPFHEHAETWLGVTHGAKRWLVYPPSVSAPKCVSLKTNVMWPVSVWFDKLYKELSAYPFPRLDEYNQPKLAGSKGYRPLECVQKAGELVYLPALWSHLTMNIGETLGVGAQSFMDKDRFWMMTDALAKSPDHVGMLIKTGRRNTFDVKKMADKIKKTGNKPSKQETEALAKMKQIAIASCRKILRLTPLDTETRLQLIDILGVDRETSAKNFQVWEKEILDAEKNLDAFDRKTVAPCTLSSAYYKLGMMLFDGGAPYIAVSSLEKAYELNKKDAYPVLVTIAKIHRFALDEVAMENALKRLLAVKKDHPAAGQLRKALKEAKLKK